MITRIVGSSDWHLNPSTPVSRNDNYIETALHKVEQLVTIANDRDAHLSIAGDIFDHTKIPSVIINDLADILSKCNHPVISVAGQHDMYYRLLNNNSPYMSLVKMGVIRHLGQYQNVFGMSFGEEINVKSVPKNAILIAHKTITKDKPPFFLKDAISAKSMLTRYKMFRVIITGDYHSPFVVFSPDRRVIVNCGSLMRKDKDQLNYKPSAYFVDLTTEMLSVETIPLEIQPPSKVFNMATLKGDAVLDDSTFSVNLDIVVQKLQSTDNRPDYKNIVFALAAQHKVSKREDQEIRDIMRVAESVHGDSK